MIKKRTSAGQLPALRTQFFPRTHLVVVSCNSLEGGVVANRGDETVFLSHIILFNTASNEWASQRFPNNKQLAPNAFLKVSSPWGQGFEGAFARGVSAQDLPILVNKAAAMTTCARMVFFARNVPMYEEEIAKSAGPTLNQYPCGIDGAKDTPEACTKWVNNKTSPFRL
jgi:hypothetical protein